MGLNKKDEPKKDKPKKTTTSGTVHVKTSLNVREKASEKASKIGKLKNGEVVNISKAKKGWLKIKTPKVKGWVSAKFVKIKKA